MSPLVSFGKKLLLAFGFFLLSIQSLHASDTESEIHPSYRDLTDEIVRINQFAIFFYIIGALVLLFSGKCFLNKANIKGKRYLKISGLLLLIGMILQFIHIILLGLFGSEINIPFSIF